MELEFHLKSRKGPKREIHASLELTDPNDSDDDESKGLKGHFRIQGFDKGFEDAAEVEMKDLFGRI